MDEVGVRFRILGVSGHGDRAVDQGEAGRGEVPQLSGRLDDHVHARTAQLGGRNEPQVRHPAEGIPDRLDAEQMEDLTDGGALGPDEVGRPEGKGDLLRVFGVPPAVLVEKRFGQGPSHLPRLGGRRFLRIDRVEVAAGRHGGRIDDRVAPGRRRDVAAAEPPHHAFEFPVRADAEAVPMTIDAGDARLDRQNRLCELGFVFRSCFEFGRVHVKNLRSAAVEAGIVKNVKEFCGATCVDVREPGAERVALVPVVADGFGFGLEILGFGSGRRRRPMPAAATRVAPGPKPGPATRQPKAPLVLRSPVREAAGPSAARACVPEPVAPAFARSGRTRPARARCPAPPPWRGRRAPPRPPAPGSPDRGSGKPSRIPGPTAVVRGIPPSLRMRQDARDEAFQINGL